MQQDQELMLEYEEKIEEAWEKRGEDISDYALYINKILELLDKGKLRVAFKEKDSWQVNGWVKKAIVLSFKIKSSVLITNGPQNSNWFDKIPLKFVDWTSQQFEEQNLRAVPGSIVRYSAYLSKNVVLMPCFVNIGAYIGDNTMIDTMATVGSCAQIGKNCHISSSVCIAGVLEPLQANPVIIEDNCFIGAGSQIAEGVIVEEGSVIAMGVFISASTRIIDRETGTISYGRVPKYSVVVSGNAPAKDGEPSLYAAIIVKKIDEKTREKTSINDLLRS